MKSFSGTVPKGAGCSKHLSLLPILRFLELKVTWTPIFFQGQDEGLVGLPFVNPLIFDLIYIEDDRLPPFKHELHLNAVELFVKLWCTKFQSRAMCDIPQDETA